MTESTSPQASQGGLTGRQKATLIVGALLVAVLVIFIVQNGESSRFEFLAWEWSPPLWLVIVISAVAGALIAQISAFFARRRN